MRESKAEPALGRVEWINELLGMSKTPAFAYQSRHYTVRLTAAVGSEMMLWLWPFAVNLALESRVWPFSVYDMGISE